MAFKALEDTELLSELLNGLQSKKDTFRSNFFKVLHYIIGTNPHRLYSKWDLFVSLLQSDNAYHKLIAVRILANLTVDAFNEYFSESENKNEILQFVREQLNSTSPKTRKKAKQFLKIWS